MHAALHTLTALCYNANPTTLQVWIPLPCRCGWIPHLSLALSVQYVNMPSLAATESSTITGSPSTSPWPPSNIPINIQLLSHYLDSHPD